jgi:hypothetical protein
LWCIEAGAGVGDGGEYPAHRRGVVAAAVELFLYIMYFWWHIFVEYALALMLHTDETARYSPFLS